MSSPQAGQRQIGPRACRRMTFLLRFGGSLYHQEAGPGGHRPSPRRACRDHLDPPTLPSGTPSRAHQNMGQLSHNLWMPVRDQTNPEPGQAKAARGLGSGRLAYVGLGCGDRKPPSSASRTQCIGCRPYFVCRRSGTGLSTYSPKAWGSGLAPQAVPSPAERGRRRPLLPQFHRPWGPFVVHRDHLPSRGCSSTTGAH
jgi:hypothetical protein